MITIMLTKMETAKVEKILNVPTVRFKELLNNPELLEGKEGFWFLNPYAFPNPAGPVLRKIRLDKDKHWVISDIDTGDDFEEFYDKHFKDAELFMHSHFVWMLEGDSIKGHLY